MSLEFILSKCVNDLEGLVQYISKWPGLSVFIWNCEASWNLNKKNDAIDVWGLWVLYPYIQKWETPTTNSRRRRISLLVIWKMGVERDWICFWSWFYSSSNVRGCHCWSEGYARNNSDMPRDICFLTRSGHLQILEGHLFP